MRLAVLGTTLREEPHPAPVTDFARAAARRGHRCTLVRHGELTLQLDGRGGGRLTGPGADELLAADLVIPRFNLRRLTRDDLYVLELLVERGVPVLNRPPSLEWARSKVDSLQRLQRAGVPVPPTAVVRQLDGVAAALAELGPGPWVVKPSQGSQGRGVVQASSAAAAREAVAVAWIEDRHRVLLLQPLLAVGVGPPHDHRLIVVSGEVVAAMRRQAPPGDFRANVAVGGAVSAITPPGEETRLAVTATAVLGLDLAGVDILPTADGPVVLEVNANPGWEGISAALAERGESFSEHLLERLEAGWRSRHGGATRDAGGEGQAGVGE